MKRMLISLSALCLAAVMLMSYGAPVYAEGSAPVAENLELRTYRGVCVGGCMAATDPDGDPVSFEVTTQPVKGTLDVKQDGSFTYTPAKGKKGRDYFGYKAVDPDGNYSQEATVIIRIERQNTDVFYEDMAGRADEYAAIALSERGIFTGERIGRAYCFDPDRAVSRGEFVSMCMLLSGEPVVSGVVSTGYVDDEDIPSWLKGYAATAAMCGVDTGRATEQGSAFAASEPISTAEAARVLSAALKVTDVSYLPLDGEMEPSAAQATANLTACGVLDGDSYADKTLTRSEAASMLAAAMDLEQRR